MKYYVVIILLVWSFKLFGQEKYEISVADTIEENKTSWAVAGGIDVKEFDVMLVRLTYLYNLNDNISFPFEFEVLFANSGTLPFGTFSIRFYQHLLQETNIYQQAGFSFVIGGVESLAIIPIFNIGVGINYKSMNIGISTIIINTNELNNSIPLFLSVGTNF